MFVTKYMLLSALGDMDRLVKTHQGFLFNKDMSANKQLLVLLKLTKSNLFQLDPLSQCQQWRK